MAFNQLSLHERVDGCGRHLTGIGPKAGAVRIGGRRLGQHSQRLDELRELPSLGVGAGVRSMHIWTAGRDRTGAASKLVCGLEDGTFVQWATSEAQ